METAKPNQQHKALAVFIGVFILVIACNMIYAMIMDNVFPFTFGRLFFSLFLIALGLTIIEVSRRDKA